MSREHDHIRLEALNLGVGDTVTTYCPYCQASHEDKLSVTMTDEGIVFRCWRVSCRAKGFIPTVPGSRPKTKQVEVKPKKFTGELSDVPDWLLSELYEKYELLPDDVIAQGFRWAHKANRIYMPNYDMYGRSIGHSVKGYGEYVGSKAYTFLNDGVIPLHFPVNQVKSDTLVIVEDVLSSVKVGKLLSSAAILGTNLGSDSAAFISKHFDQVIFALDYDAVSKAVGLSKEFRCLMKTKVVIFTEDPKDTRYSVLEEKLL